MGIVYSKNNRLAVLSKQRGMGLLEVVVSMLLIGLGMAMSISMIQLTVKNSISANNQNSARILMESIADRMRINRFAASAYQFGDASPPPTPPSVWTPPTKASLASSNPVPACTSCTATQATNRANAFDQGYEDTHNWAVMVTEQLPSAKAAILQLPNDQYRILLQWQNIPSDSRASTTAPIQEANLVFSL